VRTSDPTRNLFATDVRARSAAAAAYSVFPDGGPPSKLWREEWSRTLGERDPQQGAPWPPELARRAAVDCWPAHAFGTANASILMLWHRPGAEDKAAMRAAWIDPEAPVLGGVSHAHVERFVPEVLRRDVSWDRLHDWVGARLRAFELAQPWAAVMVACLNDQGSETGEEDCERNKAMLAPGERIDVVCQTIQPLLVIACGGPVRRAIEAVAWRPPTGSVCFVEHPSFQHWRRGGPTVRLECCSRGQTPGRCHQRARCAAGTMRRLGLQTPRARASAAPLRVSLELTSRKASPIRLPTRTLASMTPTPGPSPTRRLRSRVGGKRRQQDALSGRPVRLPVPGIAWGPRSTTACRPGGTVSD
jgi:hypothetical protein